MLASIGIVKGQPFNPTGETTGAVAKGDRDGAQDDPGAATARQARRAQLYYNDRQYENTWAGATAEWLQDGYLDVNQRVSYFQFAYSSASAMVMRTLDAGSKYPFTPADANGEFLDGSNTYKLHLPPNPPAALFWAVTAYNVTDGTMPETPQLLPSINGLQQGRDQQRRVDRYLVRPEKPAGAVTRTGYRPSAAEIFWWHLRLYGTGVEFFDQTWKPDDVVKVR